MKQYLAKIGAVLVAVSMLLTQLSMPAFAADEVVGEACANGEHEWELIKTTPATCARYGSEEYTCKVCREQKFEKLDKTADHKWGTVVEAVAPTCTEDGTIAYAVCENSGCDAIGDEDGRVVDSIVAKALGHDYTGEGTIVTPPSCDAKGYTTYTCQRSDCDYFYVDEYVDCLPHTEVEVAEIPATCMSAGTKAGTKCSVCGTVLKGCEEIPKLKHEYTTERVEPTCSGDGAIIYTCTDTSCEVYETPIEEVIPALGHDTVTVEAKEPTCTEDGTKGYTYCRRCEADSAKTLEEENRIPATDHQTITVIDSKDSTCTEEGYEGAMYCLDCETVIQSNAVIAPKGHALVDVATKEPTCQADGYTAHKKCTREGCSYTENKQTVAKIPHDMVPLEGSTNATCETEGVTISECRQLVAGGKICGYQVKTVIPALGHEMVSVAEKAPTCVEAGYKAHEYCKACGDAEKAKADAKLDALGHSYVVMEAVEPTYDSKGNTAGEVCDRCGEGNPEIGTQILPALNEEVEFVLEATGINGADVAVNSGYITLNVRMDVKSDIARIWGVHLAVRYDNTALQLVAVDGCMLMTNTYTDADTANANGVVDIMQTMSEFADKTFNKGEQLMTTLTFKVSKEAVVDAEYDFSLFCGNELITRAGDVSGAYVNRMVATCKADAEIIVVKLLGDADGNGVVNATDAILLSQWFAAADVDAYKTIYDMNKDGYIDGTDAALLRGAVVGNNNYLDA